MSEHHIQHRGGHTADQPEHCFDDQEAGFRVAQQWFGSQRAQPQGCDESRDDQAGFYHAPAVEVRG